MTPTEMEQMAQRLASQRMHEHEMRNDARRLSKDERKMKREKKWLRDAARNRIVTVYRVTGAAQSNAWYRKQLYLVRKEADRMQMSGLAVVRTHDMQQEPSLVAVVVVCGGLSATRQCDRLIGHRIDWQTNHASCCLVWQGTWSNEQLPHPFSLVIGRSEQSLRGLFADFCVEELYDIARGTFLSEIFFNVSPDTDYKLVSKSR